MDYLLKGVRAIDPAIGLDAKRDILIEDGVIARVEEAIEPAEGVKVLDRSGSLAFHRAAGTGGRACAFPRAWLRIQGDHRDRYRCSSAWRLHGYLLDGEHESCYR